MPPPTPSLLDWSQIIQRVFDEPNGRIRTDVVYSPNPGSIEVIISHTDDSIRLGDGTNLNTITQVGSKYGIDVNVLNPSGAGNTTPFVNNVTAVSANTEYSYAIPDGTTVLTIKPRNSSLKIAYTAGTSGTTYATISKGGSYTVDNINTSGITVYFQSPDNNSVVEFHGWAL